MSKNKLAGNAKSSTDKFGTFLWNLGTSYLQVARYVIDGARSASKLFWVNCAVITALLVLWSVKCTYLWWLNKLGLGSVDVIYWVQRQDSITHFFVLFGSFLLMVIFLLGYPKYKRKKKAQEAFESVCPSNNKGLYPQVLDHNKISDYRSKIRIRLNGVTPTDIMGKSQNIKNMMGEIVERVVEESDATYANVFTSKRDLPKKTLYADVVESCKQPYHFIVGEVIGNVITQDISALPHMLISGSTGTGKSVFFKQMVMSLLENSPHIQIYFIDLKQGLEMRDFLKCPNTAMVKEMGEAVNVLKEIETEMKRRFKFLEENNCNKIDHKKHKKDKIVVCVDEASVLFTRKRANETEADQAKVATEITDNLAKLSRAAGIHLVIATQKVTTDTLDTHIRDNIEGRMCFRIPSLQGSRNVIGTGEAEHLPDIPGRGIWNKGAFNLEVQTPFITTEEIERRCEAIGKEFKDGTRKLFGELVIGVIHKTEKLRDPKTILKRVSEPVPQDKS